MIRSISILMLVFVVAAAVAAEAASEAPAAQAASTLPQVSSKDFERRVLQAEQPVVLDAYAVWCGPCKLQERLLAEIGQDYAGQVATYKLDIEAAADIAERYRIDQVPAVLVFVGGEVVERHDNGLEAEQLRQLYVDVTQAP